MTGNRILLVAQARRLSNSGEGQRIRRQCELSLSEVAGAVGVSVTTLWRWENGERSPRGEPAAAWAALLRDLAKEAA